jgi:hypothetical protein
VRCKGQLQYRTGRISYAVPQGSRTNSFGSIPTLPNSASLTYHRPCAQADVDVDAKGRKRRRYRRYQTPLETLLSLPHPQQYLRPGLTLATLNRISKTPERHGSRTPDARSQAPAL